MNLFTQRALVRIADRSRELSGLLSIKHPDDARMSKLVVNQLGIVDIPANAVDAIERASATSDPSERGSLMLEAFWSTFQVNLVPEKLRLLIHGPSSLQLFDQHTVKFDGGSFSDRLELANFRGEFPGFFDNITIFRDHGIPYEKVLDRAMPGTTITLVRPNPKKHGFWMAWCNFDPSFSAFLDSADKLFNIKPVHKDTTDETEVVIFGLEAKLCRHSDLDRKDQKSRSFSNTSPHLESL